MSTLSPSTTGVMPVTSLSTFKSDSSLLKPSQISLFGSSGNARRHCVARKAFCISAQNDVNRNNSDEPRKSDDQKAANKVDRRNMLLGLGGLYGAVTTLGGLGTPNSLATPAVMDLTLSCERALKEEGWTPGGMKCCPPPFKESEITNFDPRKYARRGLRVRPAAHKVDSAYTAKFQEAMRRMKALPEDDPRSFVQQAKIHCAYCNGAYHQKDTNDEEHRLQVHNSWLFLPFHRAYLYFFERILGSLINDPNFAIPYWNWDNPEGMYMPSIYTQGGLNNPLYDEYRDDRHTTKLIDLGYGGTDEGDETPKDDQIFYNLWHMHVHVARPKEAELFIGGRYVAGDKYSINLPGSIERLPHTPVHVWAGDPTRDLREDMGSFYSAGRDPLFYAHHANIDRTWTIWKLLDGGRAHFDDPDWLDNHFIFYDENKKPVRIFVKDLVDDKTLGYVYEYSDIPWLDPLNPIVDHKPLPVPPSVELKLPKNLGPTGFRTKIFRPTDKKTDGAEEVLEIAVQQGATDDFVKFDVYLHDEHHHFTADGKTKSSNSYAGSYTELPHKPHLGHVDGDVPTKVLLLPISEVLELIGANNDDYVTVALINVNGGEVITITDMKIKYL